MHIQLSLRSYRSPSSAAGVCYCAISATRICNTRSTLILYCTYLPPFFCGWSGCLAPRLVDRELRIEVLHGCSTVLVLIHFVLRSRATASFSGV